MTTETGHNPQEKSDDHQDDAKKDDMTERVLMSLAVDIGLLAMASTRVQVQILSLMELYEISPVKA